MNMVWRRLGQSPWLFAGPAVAAALRLRLFATHRRRRSACGFLDWSLLRPEATSTAASTTIGGTLGNTGSSHLALVNTGLYLPVALIPLQVGVPSGRWPSPWSA